MDNETNRNEQTTDMQRRLILLGAGATAALGATANLWAGEEKHGMHTSKAKGLIQATKKCEEIGEDCLAHTFRTFQAGDTTLAKCAVVVDDAISICSTTAKVALNGTRHLKQVAAVCKAICADCEEECRKHGDKHQICADMADACKKVVEECEKTMA